LEIPFDVSSLHRLGRNDCQSDLGTNGQWTYHADRIRVSFWFSQPIANVVEDTAMTDTNTAQAEYWASAAGYQWIAREALMDALLSPVLSRVLQHAALQPGERVIDIGCGTGASSLAAAQAVGPAGHVTSVDISAQLLDRASTRAKDAGLKNINFVLADAQTHAFAPQSADAMISRFGVMFFEDPVAAFANMARALKPNGRMIFAAWAPATDVPWFSIPVAAAVARFGKPSQTNPDAPGPMAFQNAARVTALMEKAGLTDVRCQPEMVELTPEGDPADIITFAARIGPASRIVAEFSGTEADIKAIEAEVGKALAIYQTDKGMRIPARILLYSAGPPAQ
jgi:SAM-dependent methyltransferase